MLALVTSLLSVAFPQDPVAASSVRPSLPALAAPAALPQPLASFGCAAIGDVVLVYGGHVGRAHAHTRDNQKGALLRLDRRRAGDGWVEVGSGPALQSVALVAWQDSVIRLGGMQARNASGEPEDLWSTDEVVRFDVTTGRWAPMPVLPEARSSHDATLVGSRLVVMGGWQLAGKQRRWLDTAWSLDLADAKATWQPLLRAPFQRRALAVAAVGQRVYALGGLDAEGEMSERVDVLDLERGAWQRCPDLPGQGFAVSAVAAGGQLYASGRDGDLWRLEGERWETVNTMALPRFFHRLVPAGNGELLAVGGAGTGHLATCELVRTDREELHLQSWTVPWSHPARNRQAFAVMNDTLYVAGGNCGRKQHDFEAQHFTDQCCAIDLRTMQVQPRAALPAPRQSLGMLAAGDRLLALGGFAFAEGGARAQTAAFALPAKTAAWENSTAVLPQPRTQFGFTRAAGSYWVLGGLDYAPDRKGREFAYVETVLRWDGAGEFSVASTMPRARRAFGCATQNGRIWCVGGMKDEFVPVAEVDVFDTVTGQWSTGPAPSAPRISPFLVAVGETLVLAGGTAVKGDDSAPARTLAVVEAGASAWQDLELPIEPPLLGATAWRDRLLLVSRNGDQLRLTAVQLPQRRRT